MTISLGHCLVDLATREVRWSGRTERLTPIEAKLLDYLVLRAGDVVPRPEVLADVWGYHPDSRSETVGVIVRRLRRKIELEPGRPTVLRTVRGTGWTLV
ncbi:MAG: winged helix-turn-helix domain-containing protein, partial [Myxococcota bacterium]